MIHLLSWKQREREIDRYRVSERVIERERERDKGSCISVYGNKMTDNKQSAAMFSWI